MIKRGGGPAPKPQGSSRGSPRGTHGGVTCPARGYHSLRPGEGRVVGVGRLRELIGWLQVREWVRWVGGSG